MLGIHPATGNSAMRVNKDLCLRLPEADKMIAIEMFAAKKTNLSFTAAFNIVARKELEILHHCTCGGHGRC